MSSSIFHYYSDTTKFSLSEHLAIDELLLNHVNSTKKSSGIRFYDSNELAVVLGLGNKVKEHVNISACKANTVSILRRCSGGGSIIQGNGCLSYALFLRYEDFPECSDIKTTTETLLNYICAALQKYGVAAEMKGISDVAINNKKIIGNAQRRLKDACLFHGCILYDFDINCIASYLKAPPTEPGYRQARTHQDFVQNIELSKEKLVEAFLSIWPCAKHDIPIPIQDIQALSSQKYTREEWSFKR